MGKLPKKNSNLALRKPKTDCNAEIILCKKFKGSKEGYVFRKGSEGLGYYVDKKPDVDFLMLQALLRSASQGTGGSGRGRRSKSAGKRRGR